eukprot:3328210-Pleurochrysis_carterae.AAC.1
MSVVHGGGQDLGERVGNIVVGVYLAHLDESMRDMLSHFEVTPISMSGALARAALLGQLDRSAVVDVHRSRTHLLLAHLSKKAPQVDNFCRGVRSGDDLGF